MKLSLVFFTFFMWASSFSLAKEAMAHASPLFVTGIRMVLAGCLILGFLVVFKRKDFQFRKTAWASLILLALSSVYLTNAFEFWGLQYLSAAKACLIYSLSPFVAAALSYVQFREKITPRKIIGLLIGFFGFVPVFLYQSGAEASAGSFLGFSFPELALMFATITSVYGWILLRKLGKEDGVSPWMSNGASMLLGGCMALVHTFVTEGSHPIAWEHVPQFMKWVGCIVLVSNLLCYNLYGWLLKHFTATFLSFAGLTTPLFAAAWGFLMHRETVPAPFFISMGIIAIGLWLVYFEELRLGYMVRKTASQAT